MYIIIIIIKFRLLWLEYSYFSEDHEKVWFYFKVKTVNFCTSNKYLVISTYYNKLFIIRSVISQLVYVWFICTEWINISSIYSTNDLFVIIQSYQFQNPLIQILYLRTLDFSVAAWQQRGRDLQPWTLRQLSVRSKRAGRRRQLPRGNLGNALSC